jgi:hypothetical protein
MGDILSQFDFVGTNFMDENIDKFSPLIGKYVIEFSYLEHALNLLIAELLHDGAHDLGYIVTTKMTMANKIDLLDRFTRYEKHHELKRPLHVAPFIPELRSVNTFRNSVAHANWSVMKANGKTRVKISVDRERGVWFKNKDLGIEVLEENLERLRALSLRIQGIELDMWEEAI